VKAAVQTSCPGIVESVPALFHDSRSELHMLARVAAVAAVAVAAVAVAVAAASPIVAAIP